MKKPEKEQNESNELSRRDWMLRLAEGLVLMGFSGAASEAGALAYSTPAQAENGEGALPPGLYKPSLDHLTHVLTSDERFRMPPPGSETDYVRPRTGSFEPQFFSPEEFRVVRRMVELVLGEDIGTNGKSSPDRAQVIDEVAEWIDLAVHSSAGVRAAAGHLSPEEHALCVHFEGGSALEQLLGTDPQRICREGLDWLHNQTEGRYAADFPALSTQQQVDTLELISDARQGTLGENAGTRFFQLIKKEVIRGFYTSAAGLKELDFKGNSFYPESPGCPKGGLTSS